MARGRKLGTPVNPVPRLETPMTEKQECFARIYAETGDVDQALAGSGFVFANDDVKRALKSRLLRLASVQIIVDEIKARAVEKSALTAAGTILRFQLVYIEAMRRGDLSVAVQALREIGKFHGIYAAHNEQKKKYTQDDVDRLKKELEQAGMDFTRVNDIKPSEN